MLAEWLAVQILTKLYLGLLYPVSILYKSIAGRSRPVRVADGPITARYRFIKNASWVIADAYLYYNQYSQTKVVFGAYTNSVEPDHFE